MCVAMICCECMSTPAHQLEPEQHADPARVLYGRGMLARGVRADRRSGNERHSQRGRSRFRGSLTLGFRHSPRWTRPS